MPRAAQLLDTTDLVTLPTPSARPYDIKINSKDLPFFVEFGSNAIGSIDPATMKVNEYRLPGAAERPRRMAIATDDSVYYTSMPGGPGRPALPLSSCQSSGLGTSVAALLLIQSE